jgi:hypothetical protein
MAYSGACAWNEEGEDVEFVRDGGIEGLLWDRGFKGRSGVREV